MRSSECRVYSRPAKSSLYYLGTNSTRILRGNGHKLMNMSVRCSCYGVHTCCVFTRNILLRSVPQRVPVRSGCIEEAKRRYCTIVSESKEARRPNRSPLALSRALYFLESNRMASEARLEAPLEAMLSVQPSWYATRSRLCMIRSRFQSHPESLFVRDTTHHLPISQRIHRCHDESCRLLSS